MLTIDQTCCRYNQEVKQREQKVLLQGLIMPQPPVTESGLPEARQKPAALPASQSPWFQFANPSCTAGLAPKRNLAATRTKAPTPQPNLTSTYMVMEENQQLFVLPPVATAATATPTTTLKRAYRKPDFVKCDKCGENRKNSETHKSYMFHIFCEAVDRMLFLQWRKILQETRK